MAELFHFHWHEPGHSAQYSPVAVRYHVLSVFWGGLNACKEKVRPERGDVGRGGEGHREHRWQAGREGGHGLAGNPKGETRQVAEEAAEPETTIAEEGNEESRREEVTAREPNPHCVCGVSELDLNVVFGVVLRESWGRDCGIGGGHPMRSAAERSEGPDTGLLFREEKPCSRQARSPSVWLGNTPTCSGTPRRVAFRLCRRIPLNRYNWSPGQG